MSKLAITGNLNNMKVIIRFNTFQAEAELFDTPTGRSVYENLPLTGNVNTWGREIYFEIPFSVDLEEGASAEVSAGDLAYWPNMPAFCIFYGPTPVSTGQAPRAASAVNVFGRLLDMQPEELEKVAVDSNVRVERSG